jgi:hypothetical protein
MAVSKNQGRRHTVQRQHICVPCDEPTKMVRAKVNGMRRFRMRAHCEKCDSYWPKGLTLLR